MRFKNKWSAIVASVAVSALLTAGASSLITEWMEMPGADDAKAAPVVATVPAAASVSSSQGS